MVGAAATAHSLLWINGPRPDCFTIVWSFRRFGRRFSLASQSPGRDVWHHENVGRLLRRCREPAFQRGKLDNPDGSLFLFFLFPRIFLLDYAPGSVRANCAFR